MCPCPLSTALCKIREHKQNLDLCTVQPNQDGTEPLGWWEGKQRIWDPVALNQCQLDNVALWST